MRTSEAEAVAILRIHHSLGDGVSLMSLLLACTRKTSDPDSLPSLPGEKRQKEMDSDVSGTGVWGLILRIWAMLVLMWNTLVDVVVFIASSAFLKDTETPIKGVEGVEFHKKRIVHRTLSLDDIKIIKYAVGGVSSSGLFVLCFIISILWHDLELLSILSMYFIGSNLGLRLSYVLLDPNQLDIETENGS